MMISNHQIQSKQSLIRNLQSMKHNKCDVWDLNSNQDRKDLMKEIEKLMRRGTLSVIIIEGDRF
jgi:hypothetical protein